MEPFDKGTIRKHVPVVRTRTWQRKDGEQNSPNHVLWFVQIGEATMGLSQPKLCLQRGGRTTNQNVCRNTRRRRNHIETERPRDRLGQHWEKVRVITTKRHGTHASQHGTLHVDT